MKTKSHLLNIPFIELTRRVLHSEDISVRGYFLLPVYYLKLILVMPAAFLQYLFYSRRIKNTVITKPPLFILGHYRSGTTYLHKLLSADGRFGFLSYYDMVCPNSSLLLDSSLKNILQFFIDKLRIKTSFFNNTIPSLDEPAEEERFLINKGSAFTDYWRFMFPLCWNKWQRCSVLLKEPGYCDRWKREYMYLLKQATFSNKGKQIILKSPPNTERIQYLLDLFPDAKFIYISRNPYHVFYSTCNMWKKAITRFKLQKISGEQIEKIVFDEYIHMVEHYKKDKELIPAGNLIEIRYDDLEIDPVNLLEMIYTKLNLPDFKIAKELILKKLQQERKYQKYAYSEDVFKKIESRWGKYIDQWNEKKAEVFINEYA